LSSTAPAIHPHRDPITFQVGTFSITIPPHSFTKQPDGSFFFTEVINGVNLTARITPTVTLQYAFHAKATGVSLTGTKNPVYVTLIIGGDSGATSVTAIVASRAVPSFLASVAVASSLASVAAYPWAAQAVAHSRLAGIRQASRLASRAAAGPEAIAASSTSARRGV
jgi:hypothetical protein